MAAWALSVGQGTQTLRPHQPLAGRDQRQVKHSGSGGNEHTLVSNRGQSCGLTHDLGRGVVAATDPDDLRGVSEHKARGRPLPPNAV